MKILVFGLNYAPEEVGIGMYTTGMVEGLAALGHEVQVIAGQPYYPAWRRSLGYPSFFKRLENGVRVLRVPHYVPRRPTGARRVVHHLSFGLTSALPALWTALTWRPDVVLAVAPSSVSAPLARICARMGGARSWLHVQDFELDAAIAVGLVGPLAGRILRAAGKLCFSGFDRVSTISPAMQDRLIERGVPAERIVEVRNWASPAVAPRAEPSPILKQWQISTPHVALYSGTIANKQGLEIVTEAARRLCHRSDLTFVICGNGPKRSALEQLALDLPNIRFFDQQPVMALNDLLNLAKVHLLPQRAAASGLLFPSKLANMLESGRPVVATAEAGSDLAATVHDCGLVTPPGDAPAFAEAIEQLLDDPQMWTRFAENGRIRALTRFNHTNILGDLDAQLVALVGAPRAFSAPALS